MEWQVKKLGDVCRIIGGGTPSKSNESFYEGDIPWATVRDMRDSLLSNTQFKITNEAVEKSSTNIIPSGTIIIATRVGLGKVCILQQDTAINQDLKGVIPKTAGLDNSFLYWWLRSVAHVIVAAGTGATVQGVRMSFINSLKIPLPPIPEQKRIVAILDEAFADIEQVRAKTEQNLKNAHELFESYLQQVFSQRGEGWVEKALGDVCKFENGDRGKNYPSRSKFVESGFAFINAGHIDDGTVDFSKMNYITEENYDLLSRGKVKQGDILFCLRGSLGKFAVIEGDIQGAIASSLVIIRPHSDLSISFLLHYLRSGLCKSMIEKYAGGAAQPNLGAKDLAKFSISVPPAAQQLQTSEKLNSLMAAVENLESVYSEKLAALDELKKSILQKAFSGELTKKNSLEVAHD